MHSKLAPSPYQDDPFIPELDEVHQCGHIAQWKAVYAVNFLEEQPGGCY